MGEETLFGKEGKFMNVAITATGKDRPGIICDLTGALFKAGGNLEDASMTILEGEFAMIFLASVDSQKAYQKLLKQLELLKRKGLAVTTKEIKRRLVRGEKHQANTSSWIISVLGKDRAGIVYHVSNAAAQHGLNITDLNSKIIGTGGKTGYALILEIDIPNKAGFSEKLNKSLQTLARKLSVTINLNPVDSEQF